MKICIFEDKGFKNFLPLVYLRPVYELRSGVFSLREKIERLFPGTTIVLHSRKELADLLREENPGRRVNTFPNENCWFVNGRLLANAGLRRLMMKHPRRSTTFVSNHDVAAAYVRKSDMAGIARHLEGRVADDSLFGSFLKITYDGTLVGYPWDLIHSSPAEIRNDMEGRSGIRTAGKSRVYRGSHLLNRKNIVLGSGCIIKPGAVLDAEDGPIVLGNDVVVMPNAFVQGPAFIGDGSVIKVGAKIYHGTSIGKRCKVGGEVEMSIIQSYSNKQHDGFLGHSYLGSWVNIGADTNTSDLKNTYGTVKVDIGGAAVDSGVQFLGLIMGDHSKTGINVMFNTGTVVGISCNIYGAGLPMKFVPSYSWGGEQSFSEYSFEKSMDTARKVMARRAIDLGNMYEKVLASVFSATRGERKKRGVR
jgi:UDP-N-acetylglucosamine diphosphorylase / glucose-1-phosphate thymidylyltransferase / UDP-N-acetylgalactosamine diphosphorylase / glucosamine-1-phosphate N-acetyltransferase / galactosamine-1-phosphate N-acetyltransferase